MDTYRILEYLRGNEGPAVLATVIAVEGHSYRKEGAAMLFLPNGGTIGSISPGCLESDLAERMPVILGDGSPEIVTYNMKPEEDPIWGEAIGCGGVIRVLLESVQGRLLTILRKAYLEVDSGRETHLVRERRGSRIRYSLVGGYVPTKPIARKHDIRNQLYKSIFVPRPRMILFGAGQDSIFLNLTLQRIGFRVVVSDWRTDLLTSERFPGAELVSGVPREIVHSLVVGRDDYVVVCSHQMRQDKEFLRFVLPIRPAYIGIMGSRKRIIHLLDGLPVTPNVYAPVGLDIGAEGPEEIAVSVAAELIAVRASKKTTALREGAEDAHSGYLFSGGAEQENGLSQNIR
ncbi:XdhC family protein [Cohnella sp.]|uniref:XdhC family protein n=1 Tax=Cohnella sp. TaxID=1883426 RepID=UPI00356907DB